MDHVRKDCVDFKAWLIKKGIKIFDVFVTVEYNMVFIPQNSWWFDTSCSIHITNSLQGFQSRKRTSMEVYNVCIGNGNKVAIEFVGTVKLRLSTGYVLTLINVLYVPSMRRNLFSVIQFAKDRFYFIFIMFLLETLIKLSFMFKVILTILLVMHFFMVTDGKYNAHTIKSVSMLNIQLLNICLPMISLSCFGIY